MSERWLEQVSRVYSGLVIAASLFSITVVAGSFFPRALIRGYELAVERATTIALSYALLSLFIGSMMCLLCLWFRVEPPALLVRCTLMAVLLCTFSLLFLPVIAAS